MRGLQKSDEQRKLETKYLDAEYSYQDNYQHGTFPLGNGWVMDWKGKTYFSLGGLDWYVLLPKKEPQMITSELRDDFNVLILTGVSPGIAEKKPERRRSVL